MIDLRREMVLKHARGGGAAGGTRAKDKTDEVVRYSIRADGGFDVVFFNREQPYHFPEGQIAVLRHPRPVAIPGAARVEVDGVAWDNVTELVTFAGSREEWTRVFYRVTDGSERSTARPAASVRVVSDTAADPGAAAVLNYLRSVLAQLPKKDPLHDVYRSLDFVHPDSALARYLTAAPIVAREDQPPAIFPFRRNLSQWQAVDNALTHPLSVIEGPPGTGKTETILNLVSSIVAAKLGTVGVVSFNNAAVENVHDKLREAGFDHMVAMLGNKEHRQEFFDTQDHRARRMRESLARPVQAPQPDRLTALDVKLRSLYATERERAQDRNLLTAFRLEHEHFTAYLARHEPPDLADIPLASKSPRRILRFLAETAEDRRGRPGLVRRLRRYLRYGPLYGLDAQDTDVLLRLQDAFYRNRIAELTTKLADAERRLAGANFDQLAEEHRDLSLATLGDALHRRYAGRSRATYDEATYLRGKQIKEFVFDHPVILSTCHSLRSSLGSRHLLDYLIIDEASQVDLLVAAPALATCRTAVIVGDKQQLANIATGAADRLTPPRPAYDYARHSILASVTELYGAALPSIQLKEHYRCDPAIIGYCNRAFYSDELVPYTTSRGTTAMEVRPTPPGHHHRRHTDGGRSNQRELDVIAQEVVPELLRAIPADDIGITTPFRRQVDKAADLLDRHQTDTVHRFQGRQKRVVIMSTVIDDSWRGKTALSFVDDPKLVNVAVSRAVERFVLVTDDHFHPSSRHLRDLVDYIKYQNPGTPIIESAVVSVFDLLYQEYSKALEPFARRLHGGSKFASENIVETLLAQILAEKHHANLDSCPQVALRNLLFDLEGMTERERAFVTHHRTSVDFVVYNRVGYVPLLAIEVDGFSFHENDAEQLRRDRLKDAILERVGLPLLRLPTTGSGEEERIRAAIQFAQQARDQADIDLTPARPPQWIPKQPGERDTASPGVAREEG